jgi:AraC-like DNA-binding protein
MRCLNFSLHTRPQRLSGFRIGVDTLDAGFQNASHFARVFRKLEGTKPSRFRADYASRAKLWKSRS